MKVSFFQNLEKVSKFFLFFLCFSIFLFFFPLVQSFLDFSKFFLFSSIISLVFFLFIIETFQKGKLQIKSHPLHLLFLVFFFFFLLSFFFSKAKWSALFGLPQNTSISFGAVFYFLIFYFFLNIFFEKEDFRYLIFLLFLSSFLVLIFAFFQFFGKFLFPFLGFRTREINFFGTQNSFSLFLAIFLPSLVFFKDLTRGFLKTIIYFFIFLSIFFLIVINHKPSWFILGTTSLFSLFLLTQKKEKREISLLSLFFVALSILFLTSFSGKSSFFENPLPISEVFKIGFASLKEKPIFGTGPTTFSFNYLKFASIFPQNVFVPHFIIFAFPLGFFGIISYFFFLLFPILFGLKNWEELSQENIFLPIFLLVFGTTISQLFYPFSFSLYFFFFLVLGMFANVSSNSQMRISLSPSLSSILILISFSLILWLEILTTKTLVSEVFYFKGVLAWQKGELENSLSLLNKAKNLNEKIDYYWRDLAQIYLAKLSQKLQQKDTQIIEEVKNAIEFSKKATELNSLNPMNFSVRAFVYHSLAGLVRDSEKHAILNWEEAIKRDPKNPYYWTQKGVMHLRLAILGQEKEKSFEEAEKTFKKAIEIAPDYAPARFQMAILWQTKGETEKAIEELENAKALSPFDVGIKFQLGVLYYQKRDFEKAKKELEEAVFLFPDYSNALYFLGLTYDELGEKDKAIEKFEKVSQLNPEVEEVKKIIQNLKEGKKALEGISQTVPPTTPIETPPEEIKK